MSNDNRCKSFIPQVDGRALDFIKICAAILMVIDHMNFMWFGLAVPQMSLMGRVVFPLFAYGVAVAVQRGGLPRVPQYAGKLLFTAVAVEAIVQLARPTDEVNVIFTLAVGAMCAGYALQAKNWQILLCYAAALASVAVKIPMEFGLPGIALPSALLLVMQGRRLYIVPLVILLFSINLGGMGEILKGAPTAYLFSPDVIASVITVGFFSSVLPYIVLRLATSLPQTGRYLSRYFLQIFYPGHMVALWLLGMFFFK